MFHTVHVRRRIPGAPPTRRDLPHPTSLRRSATFAIAALILAAAGNAALGQTPGTYTTTGPTGGVVVATSPAANPSTTDTYYTGTVQSYGGSKSLTGINTSVSCSGDISTTFTYQPNAAWDTPPQVIITQTCRAQGGGSGQGCSGSANNGLGDAATNTSYNGAVTYTSSGTHYQLVPGAATITQTLSPDAMGNAGTQNTPVQAASNGSVSYSISESPVRIGLTGVTPSADGSTLNVLTGQQITATLVYPFKVSNINWSTAAADAFKTYSETAAINQLTPLADADKHGTSFSFYTASTENAKVTCTATITCPDNTTVFNVSLTQLLTSLQPAAVVDINDPNSPKASGAFVDTTVMPYLAGAQEVWWPATITVPAPFAGGTGCFAQLITKHHVQTRIPTPGSGASSTYTTQIPNGAVWEPEPANSLDSGFPYATGYVKNADGTISTVTTNYTWDAGGQGYSGDAPRAYDVPPLVTGDTGGTDWIESDPTESFQTWVMYKPPAVGTQGVVWVPLANLTWSWAAQVGDNVGNWQYYAPDPEVLNSSAAVSHTSSPPQWSSTNGGEQQRPS